MHSPGCFSLFDERARILFSADIGAAVFPEGQDQLFIEDFGQALPYTEGFHRRYIASNSVARKWSDLVARLNPAMIAPQHGGIYRGPAVKAFLAWLSGLRCGVDLVDEIFR
jgi:flavorubredoxin